MTYWDAQEVGDKGLHQRIGPLHLWVERTAAEWRVAVRRTGDSENLAVDESTAKPTDPHEWQRFAVTGESHRLRLVPIMPDRPVIVRPESQLTITAGSDCRFYVLIPGWIRLIVGDGDGKVLTEIPSVVLSNSWFGEPDEGVLCYAMRTTARRTKDELPQRQHQAFCPVTIHNSDKENLVFNRLCVRVGPLSIFADDDRLWTNEIKLRHVGRDDLNQLDYGKGSPEDCDSDVVISGPRDTRQSWMSWARLRGLTSLVR